VASQERETPRRLSAGERRELILRGATELFAERGYDGTSMGDIARAAGITPAVIYDHFGSKAELQITLLRRETEQMLASIASALEAAPNEPSKRLRAGVDAFFAFVAEHPFAWRMMFRDPPLDPAVAAAYRELGDRTTGAVAVFVQASAPAAMLAGPDGAERIETFAKLLTSAQTGLAFWWYEHREVPREVVVDRFLEFCWIGLERVAAGERID
jgi:AcrR family transcriptional regulator